VNLKNALCVIGIITALPASANEPALPGVATLLKRQSDAWDAAIIRKDRRAVAANMADSFMQIDSNGRIADKKHFLDDITAPNLTITPYVVDDFRIRVYGNAALLTGSTDMHGTMNGKPFTTHYRYTDVYVKEHGSWKVVNVQTTHIK
jgi:ketosteroid isomerase-like protein